MRAIVRTMACALRDCERMADRISQPDLLMAVSRLTETGDPPAAVARDLGVSLCELAGALFGDLRSDESAASALGRVCDFQDEFALRRRRLAAILMLDDVVNAPLETATPLDRLRSIELRRRACVQMLRLCAGETIGDQRDEPDREEKDDADRSSSRSPLFRSPLDGILEPLLSGLMRPLRPKKPKRERDENRAPLHDFARETIAAEIEAASRAAESEEHRADLRAAAEARERQRGALAKAAAAPANRSFVLAPPNSAITSSIDEPTVLFGTPGFSRPPPIA